MPTFYPNSEIFYGIAGDMYVAIKSKMPKYIWLPSFSLLQDAVIPLATIVFDRVYNATSLFICISVVSIEAIISVLLFIMNLSPIFASELAM